MIFRSVVFLAVLALTAAGSEFTGKVVKVADGDTITVLDGKIERKVRLVGIDAPEKGQPFSDRAKRELSSLAFGKVVRVTWKTRDKYERILGDVYVSDTWVNRVLVERGMAWAYQPSTTKELKAAEAEARKARLGLWSDKTPVPPWEFRKRRREG